MKRLYAALALVLAGPAVLVAQQPRLIIVGGLGGTPEYGNRFHDWAVKLYQAARQQGLSDDAIVFLAEDAGRDRRIDGRSTRDAVAAALTAAAADTDPADPVTIVYLGHGSVREGDASMNLPGPDMAPSDLAPLLDALAPRPVSFVNTAPASGGFLESLAGPERTLITATRGAMERNETFFGGFFVEAFAGDDADADKDGRVSLLEAYEYARREVARRYESEGLILTEHALLDDNGDGVGTHEIAALPAADGLRARRQFLAGDPALMAGRDSEDPELRRLYGQKAAIQGRIDDLRARRETMEQAAYDDALEALLIELALVNRQIAAREGGPP